MHIHINDVFKLTFIVHIPACLSFFISATFCKNMLHIMCSCLHINTRDSYVAVGNNNSIIIVTWVHGSWISSFGSKTEVNWNR